ncbi:MAG: ribonuclease III [Erysipelotrichia bacterium]|nr:ribonuclease III [Erysipelotrichia bacterium]
MKDIFEWLDSRNIPYRNRSLIEQACTHTSFLNEHRQLKGDNERLEFMGDAVLQLYSTTLLFNREPALSEGDMTRLRSQLVREEALSKYSRQLNWNQFIMLGIGEEKNGGRERDSILADMFEAILGAIYIDCGYDAASKILDEVLVPQLVEHSDELVVDYKTKLQEFIQADTRNTVTYNLVKSVGPSNSPTFYIDVVLDGIVLGKGEGPSKKKAEQAAAKNAFEKLVK